MGWIKVVTVLLQIVAAIVKSRSDKEQQQIGEDRAVREALLSIATRMQIAKQIDEDSLSWTDTDIDDRLSNYYRNEGQ